MLSWLQGLMRAAYLVDWHGKYANLKEATRNAQEAAATSQQPSMSTGYIMHKKAIITCF